MCDSGENVMYITASTVPQTFDSAFKFKNQHMDFAAMKQLEMGPSFFVILVLTNEHD